MPESGPGFDFFEGFRPGDPVPEDSALYRGRARLGRNLPDTARRTIADLAQVRLAVFLARFQAPWIFTFPDLLPSILSSS